jgi:hypothetical protein
LDVSVLKRGPKLATKIYRKPTHAGHYLHFKFNHPLRVKMGIIPSLISRTEVIRQDQKDFNNEIKIIRYDLMLNEYPQEFVDAVMKPLRSNLPS